MKLGTLRVRMMIVMLMMTLTPSIVTGYVSFKSQQKVVKASIERKINESSLYLSTNVGEYLKERLTDLQFLSTNPILQNHNDVDLIQQEIYKFLATNPIYYEVVIINPKGVIKTDARGKLIGVNIAHRTWFRDAMSGRTVISDLYDSSYLKKSIVVMAKPIRTNGKIVGVVTTVLDIPELWKTINRYSKTLEGQYIRDAMLVNKSGQYIAQEHEVLDQPKMTDDYGLDASVFTRADDGIYRIQSERKHSIIGIAPIERFREFDHRWYIVVDVALHELTGPLQQLLYKYMLIYTLMCLFSVAFSLYFSKLLIQPVEHLVEATKRYAKDRKFLPLSQVNFSEIEKLNDAFVQMTTELQEQEAQLIRSEKLKYVANTASKIVHEIKNPLQSIRGFLQMFLNPEHAPLQEKYIPMLIREVDAINAICDDLMSLSRPADLQFSKQRMGDLAEEVRQLLVHEMSNKSIEFTLTTVNDPEFWFDRKRMRQVVLNIVKNAIEASDFHGTIQVSLDVEGLMFILKVKDDGHGISEEHLSHIGTIYYTTKENGNGVGLATCMQIVEEHGGKLTIHSQENVGTTIQITLPLQQKLA